MTFNFKCELDNDKDNSSIKLSWCKSNCSKERTDCIKNATE